MTTASRVPAKLPAAAAQDAAPQPDVLALIRDLLRLEVARMRAAGIPVGEDEFRGLYTSDEEADRLLRDGAAGVQPGADFSAVRVALSSFVESDEGRVGELARIAGLDPFEANCVLLCLASEADLGIERLIGYVQDDVTKRRPRIDLALRLLAEDVTSAGAAFEATSALRRLRLISLHDEPGQPHTPLRAKYIALDPRVAAYLMGRDGIDEALELHCTLRPAGAETAAAHIPAVAALAKLPSTSLEPPVVALSGADGMELRSAAEQLAAPAGLGLLCVRLLPLSAELGFELALTLAQREAALQGAALLLEGVDELTRLEEHRLRQRLRGEHVAKLVILASKTVFNWPGVSVEVPEPGFDAQRTLWRNGLADEGEVSNEDLETLAGKFRLPTANIADAVLAARGRATSRDPERPAVRLDDLYAAARTQSTPILSDVARKIIPHYSWNDIVLPEDAQQQLREVCAFVEHRHLVYDVWGLGKRLAMGKGLMSLFAGQSGTGKTMAADVMAGTLGLDLYKIDLSGVVSKYIGETEKNLASIFDEASTSNAILFFDEADALFGKRSEVKDAHDRYANIETAYLLQKMEEYSGVVILATNLKMNLDEAFLRRLHFVIDYPMPDEDDRRRIWQTTMPLTMPLTDDLDIPFLAKQFKIAGGNIRNIVLAAAFMAASEGSDVGMRHCIRAVRREYQKLGRMVTDAEFGPYVGLVR
jgi:AAA+ superfamily predicted ATPase